MTRTFDSLVYLLQGQASVRVSALWIMFSRTHLIKLLLAL